MEKPTIYFCIELKNRELDSQVLLASKLTHEGYRCYVGTHASIFTLLASKKATYGVFFDKGTLPLERMKWIREKCEAIVVLDQEMSPVTSDPLFWLSGWPSRIYPETENLIDRYLCVGPEIYAAALLRFNNDTKKVVMTGWPRVDLWRWYGNIVYAEEISEIRKTYGDFLLMISSFGVSSETSLTNPDEGYVPTSDKNYLDAISIIEKWDSDKSFPKVVIRPHISEDIRLWKETFKGFTKTYVSKNSNVTPWVLASTGIIHSGSTVSLEAKLAGKSVGLLTNNIKNNLGKLTVIASDYAINKEGQKHINNKESQISDFVLLEDEPSISRIIREINSMDIRSEPEAKILKVVMKQLTFQKLIRLLGLIRHEIKWKLKLTSAPPYTNYVPNGIRKRDITRITHNKGVTSGVRIRRITLNCWELDQIT
jgi:surface carbohydrate biosynthesis protein